MAGVRIHQKLEEINIDVPLKGKVMNIRDATTSQIMKNTEITNLKKIIGLETNKKYTNTKSLRYGKIMIMTDQDHDGSHIKGLVMNLFHSLWPELLELGFITSMTTPIIKATKGSEKYHFIHSLNIVNGEKKQMIHINIILNII